MSNPLSFSRSTQMPKLAAALCCLGLSLTSVLGSAHSARSASISDLYLSPALGSGNSVAMNIDGSRDVKVYWENIKSGTEFCLELGSNVSWWKGIKIFNSRHSSLGLISRSDNAKRRICDTFTTAELKEGQSAAKIEFWKAKGFGVHTHMDTLEFSPSSIAGKRVIFNWVKE